MGGRRDKGHRQKLHKATPHRVAVPSKGNGLAGEGREPRNGVGRTEVHIRPFNRNNEDVGAGRPPLTLRDGPCSPNRSTHHLHELCLSLRRYSRRHFKV